MQSLDLLGTIGMTAGAVTVIAVLGVSYRVVVALAAWFVVITGLGVGGFFDYRGGAGTPGLGVAVLLPVLGVVLWAARSARLRAVVRDIPVTTLIGINAVRVLGVFFVLLYAAGRLPAPFPPEAGWGDILIGVTALPVAAIVAARAPGWRFTALLWNGLGLLDLVTAIFLGATSAEGSPIRLFTGEPSTLIMSGMPWVLIPAFLVPLLMLTHVAVSYRLARVASPAQVAHA
jgi:hypothetical protein